MGKRRLDQNRPEKRLLDGLEQLEQYEEWASKILPMVQKDLANGLGAEDIIKKYEAFAAARLVSDLVSPNRGSEAAKYLVDRVQGKATQKVDTTHRYGKMTDEELDSFIKSKEAELTGDEKH